jgi:ribonuclease HI
MAIYTTIQLSINDYADEPVCIFTDSLNSLYLINTQIRHPSTHNNHQDKTILQEIVTMLLQRTQPTSLHKVKAHTNFTGNEIANALAKRERKQQHHYPSLPH